MTVSGLPDSGPATLRHVRAEPGPRPLGASGVARAPDRSERGQRLGQRLRQRVVGAAVQRRDSCPRGGNLAIAAGLGDTLRSARAACAGVLLFTVAALGFLWLLSSPRPGRLLAGEVRPPWASTRALVRSARYRFRRATGPVPSRLGRSVRTDGPGALGATPSPVSSTASWTHPPVAWALTVTEPAAGGAPPGVLEQIAKAPAPPQIWKRRVRSRGLRLTQPRSGRLALSSSASALLVRHD